MSLDGYIARPDDDISWLEAVEKEGEDYGYSKFTAKVDTVILGRRTYEKVLSMGIGFPHANKECYIITRKPQAPIGKLKFYTGDLKVLIKDLKAQEGGTIFCDGGAQVASMLLHDRLVDEFIISVIPILLGDGIRLFKAGLPEQQLQLLNATNYDTGLVQLHYKRK